jgi:hypothetical protein
LTLTVSASVDGEPSSASLAFEILAPTGVSLTSKTQSVNIDTDGDGDPALIFSDPQIKGLGIAFQGMLTASSDGEIAYLQLIRPYRSHTTVSGTVKTIDSKQNDWLDDSKQAQASTQAGVFQFLPTPATAGTRTTLLGDDAPSNPLGTSDTKSVAQDSFKLYMMYRPSLPNAIWVTLAQLLWSWEGVAQKGATGSWALVSSSHSIDPTGSVSAELPMWSVHFQAHRGQW